MTANPVEVRTEDGQFLFDAQRVSIDQRTGEAEIDVADPDGLSGVMTLRFRHRTRFARFRSRLRGRAELCGFVALCVVGILVAAAALVAFVGFWIWLLEKVTGSLSTKELIIILFVATVIGGGGARSKR